jgi:hypothetical protein
MRYEKSMKTIVLMFLLAISLTGCAAILALLPKVVAAVQIAEEAVNAIQVFADGRVMDQDLRNKIDTAANVARAALASAVSAAKGSGALAQKNVVAAFDDFGKAYQDLLDLVKLVGVDAVDAPKMTASPNHLTVPSAAALRAEMDK